MSATIRSQVAASAAGVVSPFEDHAAGETASRGALRLARAFERFRGESAELTDRINDLENVRQFIGIGSCLEFDELLGNLSRRARQYSRSSAMCVVGAAPERRMISGIRSLTSLL